MEAAMTALFKDSSNVATINDDKATVKTDDERKAIRAFNKLGDNRLGDTVLVDGALEKLDTYEAYDTRVAEFEGLIKSVDEIIEELKKIPRFFNLQQLDDAANYLGLVKAELGKATFYELQSLRALIGERVVDEDEVNLDKPVASAKNPVDTTVKNPIVDPNAPVFGK